MAELVRDRLKTLQLGNIGTELSDASKNAYLNLSEREMKSAIAIGDLIQKTKTFNGSTIPNAGAILPTTITDEDDHTVQPAVGVSWNISCIRIENLDPMNHSTFTLELYDGTTALPIFNGTINAATVKQFGLVSDGTGSYPALQLDVTNALYLRFSQTNANPVRIDVAYTLDVI